MYRRNNTGKNSYNPYCVTFVVKCILKETSLINVIHDRGRKRIQNPMSSLFNFDLQYL